MSMPSSAHLTPPTTSLQAHDYLWRLANPQDLPRSWIRTAFGAEAWLGRKGYLSGADCTIQITTALRILSTGISLVHLEYQMTRALIHLRFHHPEVACRVIRLHSYAYPGCPPEVSYTLAKDVANPPPGGVRQASVLRITESAISPLCSVKIFTILDTKKAAADLEVGTRLMLVFVFHPILWDGVSSRTFVGDFLRSIGDLWSDEASHVATIGPYDWGAETDNLAGPILQACAIDTRDEYTRKLQQGSVSISQTIRRSIEPQSHDLWLAVKHLFGPDYTLTHLGHAAMLLALLRVCPMPPRFPSSAAVVSPMLVDGRRYLKGEGNDRRYGSCLATAFVDFAPLDQ
ncbi:hypothetical protein LX36DRAFT_683690 [Colletotrichum falcatum]|nr:hypothetical protein LX36DRAFT_683690 [Colletotrichum falcatum]